MSMPESVYLPDGDGFFATELARGPWNPHAQHGGPPSALLAQAVERHDPGPPMHVARLTIELLRPVPLGPIEVQTRMVRPGKKVQLVEASLLADGTEVARATGLRIRTKELELPADAQVDERLPLAAGVEAFAFEREGPIMFGSAMEFRPARGRIDNLGPAAIWFRLRVPIVAGEESSPLMRVAAAADFGNGVSSVVDWNSGWMFINPDLTITLSRYPTSEWIGLDAVTYPSDDGVGFAESALYDEQGSIGRSVQALLFDTM